MGQRQSLDSCRQKAKILEIQSHSDSEKPTMSVGAMVLYLFFLPGGNFSKVSATGFFGSMSTSSNNSQKSAL